MGTSSRAPQPPKGRDSDHAASPAAIASQRARDPHADLAAIAAADAAKQRPVPFSPSMFHVALQSALNHLDASTCAVRRSLDAVTLFPVASPNLLALIDHLALAREVVASVLVAESPTAFPNERP